MELREQTVSVEDLLLDPLNMRFQSDDDFVRPDDARFHEDGVQLRAYRKLREHSLEVLKNSILANGFVPVERLVVRPYEYQEGKFVVIEGNRRLAALRWISEDLDSGVNVRDDVKETLKAVPVLILEDKEEEPALYESLMGIRHVGGIKEWGGYESARLIAQIRDNYDLDSSAVAERVGLSTQESNRRYRAFKAMEQMAESEDFGDYESPSLYPLFHEALSLPIVRSWLGWSNDSNEFENDEELIQFYELITPRTGDEEELSEPKVKSHRDVRELRSILPHAEAKRVLLDPDRALFDAVVIYRREELSHSWKTQVAEAIDALRSVGALELEEATDEDVEEIQKLKEAADSLLRLHEKLKD